MATIKGKKERGESEVEKFNEGINGEWVKAKVHEGNRERKERKTEKWKETLSCLLQLFFLRYVSDQ